MYRVAEMEHLTEDIIRSHEQRMAALTARRADVQSALSDTRCQMAARHIAQVAAAVELRAELGEDAAARHAAVAKALAASTTARAGMSANQRASLAKATADRQAEVRSMRADTQRAMREVHGARVAGEAELRAELDASRSDLFQQVSDLMAGIKQAHGTMAVTQRDALVQGCARLAAETATFLGEAASAHAAMAKAQRETLETGRTALHADVATTLGGFHGAREELAANLADFSQAWQSFTETMQARRAGRMPSASVNEEGKQAQARSANFTFEGVHHPEPWPAVKPVQAKPKAKAAPNAASEAVVEAATLPSDEAVFSYLADHPDGLRLVELEEHFGTPRIRLKDILNRLIDENKARKDDERKLFFAT